MRSKLACLIFCVFFAVPISSMGQTTASGSLGRLLPASVRQSGVLRVAGDASFPPFFYLDEKNQFRGFDVDIATAVAQVLGLKPEFTNIKTEGLLGGLQAQRFDVGMSGLIDRPIREKSFDFVDYYRGSSSLLVKNGNPLGITPKTICGKSLAVGKGTAADISVIPELSKRCESANNAAITAMEFPDYSAAVLAVGSGRAPAGLTLFAINRWIEAKSNGSLDDGGVLPVSFHVGIAVLKGNDALVKALYAAVEQLMNDGTYKQLLSKYNILDNPLQKPLINQPNT